MPSRSGSKRKKPTKSVKKIRTNLTKHSPSTYQGILHGNEKEVDGGDHYVLVGQEEEKEGYTLTEVPVISATHNQMEEPSNGKVELQEENREVENGVGSVNEKLEETQKVESQEVDIGEVNAVVESVREIGVDGKSETVTELYDGGESRNLEEEKEALDSVIESVVSFSTDLSQGIEELVENSIGLEKEEKVSLSSVKTNGISPAVMNEVEETKLLSSDEKDGSSEVVTTVVERGIEEPTLPTSDETNGVPVVVTDAVSRGIEETKLSVLEQSAGEASKESVHDRLQPSENVPAVETSNAGEEDNTTTIPESTGNPHVISVSQRTVLVQPTSWRSCCGLFEVLRRSDR